MEILGPSMANHCLGWLQGETSAACPLLSRENLGALGQTLAQGMLNQRNITPER